MNILAIMQGVDVSRVPLDALPPNMTLVDAHQRILCAVASAFMPIQPHADAAPVHGAPAFRPRADALQAVRDNSVSTRAPASAVGSGPIEPVVTEDLQPSPPEQDAVDWQALADQLLEEIDGAGTVEHVQQVEAEIRVRMDQLKAADPVLHAGVHAALMKADKEARARQQISKRIEDVGAARIKKAIENIRAFYTRSEQQWQRGVEGKTAREIRASIETAPANALVLRSAQEYHPALYAEMVALLDKGRGLFREQQDGAAA